MINQDAFKAVIHDDDTFKEVLETKPEEVLETLNEMYLRVSSQIIKYGDERKEWFRKASSFSALLKHRITEAESFIRTSDSGWKSLAEKAIRALWDHGHGPDDLPDFEDIKDVQEWVSGFEYEE